MSSASVDNCVAPYRGHFWTSRADDLDEWSWPWDYPTTTFGNQTSRLVYCAHIGCEQVAFLIQEAR